MVHTWGEPTPENGRTTVTNPKEFECWFGGRNCPVDSKRSYRGKSSAGISWSRGRTKAEIKIASGKGRLVGEKKANIRGGGRERKKNFFLSEEGVTGEKTGDERTRNPGRRKQQQYGSLKEGLNAPGGGRRCEKRPFRNGGASI